VKCGICGGPIAIMGMCGKICEKCCLNADSCTKCDETNRINDSRRKRSMNGNTYIEVSKDSKGNRVLLKTSLIDKVFERGLNLATLALSDGDAIESYSSYEDVRAMIGESLQ
jgi:hypothetical protein